MIKVQVAKLVEGQVLAQDVSRDDGVVLMTKGREITPEVISLLERLQVDSVVVEGDAFASEEERQAYVAQAEEALRMRFSRVENDPLLMAIREILATKLRDGCILGGPKANTPATDNSEKLLKPGGKRS